jgi:hypothetical protein
LHTCADVIGINQENADSRKHSEKLAEPLTGGKEKHIEKRLLKQKRGM